MASAPTARSRSSSTKRRASATAPAKRKAAEVVQDQAVARSIKSSLQKLDGSKALGFHDAIREMERGAVVRRVDPAGMGGRFHRIHKGEVQTAETEQALVDGHWRPSKTDIAAFYASSFRVVTVKVQVVELSYG